MRDISKTKKFAEAKNLIVGYMLAATKSLKLLGKLTDKTFYNDKVEELKKNGFVVTHDQSKGYYACNGVYFDPR